jgi:hypothetical protein
MPEGVKKKKRKKEGKRLESCDILEFLSLSFYFVILTLES